MTDSRPYWMIQDILQLKLPAVQHAGLSSHVSVESHKDRKAESKKPKSANNSQQLIRIYLNKLYEHATQAIISQHSVMLAITLFRLAHST